CRTSAKLVELRPMPAVHPGLGHDVTRLRPPSPIDVGGPVGIASLGRVSRPVGALRRLGWELSGRGDGAPSWGVVGRVGGVMIIVMVAVGRLGTVVIIAMVAVGCL